MACRSGKLPYATPQAANVALAHMSQRHTANGRHGMKWAKGQAVAYRCPLCREWHVGHQIVHKKISTTKIRNRHD